MPVVVEVDGKTARLVLADTDLDNATGRARKSIFYKNGKFCDAMSTCGLLWCGGCEQMEKLISDRTSRCLGAAAR